MDDEKRAKCLANLELSKLKPSSELTEEERIRQSEICRKGAYATAQKKRLKRTLRETTLAMLEKGVSKEQARRLIGENISLLDEDNLDLQAIITASMIQSAIEGNAKAFEVLRDTSGQGIKTQLEVDASVTMSESDRALMEKVASRLKCSPTEDKTE